jgi:hypothetical protein
MMPSAISDVAPGDASGTIHGVGHNIRSQDSAEATTLEATKAAAVTVMLINCLFISLLPCII